MARTCCRAFVRPDSKIIISIGEEKHLKNGLAKIPSAKPSYQPRSAELPFTCNPATGRSPLYDQMLRMVTTQTSIAVKTHEPPRLTSTASLTVQSVLLPRQTQPLRLGCNLH